MRASLETCGKSSLGIKENRAHA